MKRRVLAAEALVGKDTLCANCIAGERSGRIQYWVKPEPKKE